MLSARRTVEVRVEGAKLDGASRGPEVQSGGKLDGVITTKCVTLRQGAGRAHERFAEVDDIVGSPFPVELTNGSAQVRCAQRAITTMTCERRAGLDVRNKGCGHSLGMLASR